ncbi:hypothetical protein D9M71_530350 [compost metagenome]
MLQQRLIGIGTGRVLQTVLARNRVLLDPIAFVVDPQQILILMSVQPLIAGLRPVRQSNRLFIGTEVRIP